MKVRNIGSNQTEVELADGTIVLVSYSTPVAARVVGRGVIRTEVHHSRTTEKHITQWLGGWAATAVPQAELDQLC